MSTRLPVGTRIVVPAVRGCRPVDLPATIVGVYGKSWRRARYDGTDWEFDVHVDGVTVLPLDGSQSRP